MPFGKNVYKNGIAPFHTNRKDKNMLTKDDVELLEAYRDLTDEQRETVLDFLRVTFSISSKAPEATCDSQDQLLSLSK